MNPKEIARQHSTMGYLSGLIGEGISSGDKDKETIDFVGRNVRYLEIMIAKDYWTNEDMTAVNQAIADGNAYLGV